MTNFRKVKIKSFYNSISLSHTCGKTLNIALCVLKHIDNIYTAKLTELFLDTRNNISYTSKISLTVRL